MSEDDRPMRCAARAMAGAAFWGSAQPSVGTMQSANELPVTPGMSAARSVPRTMRAPMS